MRLRISKINTDFICFYCEICFRIASTAGFSTTAAASVEMTNTGESKKKIDLSVVLQGMPVDGILLMRLIRRHGLDHGFVSEILPVCRQGCSSSSSAPVIGWARLQACSVKEVAVRATELRLLRLLCSSPLCRFRTRAASDPSSSPSTCVQSSSLSCGGVIAQQLPSARGGRREYLEAAGAPYSVSPTTGWPSDCMCTRIW